jgi:hypothetical protein
MYIAFFPDKSRTLNALRAFLDRENDKDVKLLKTSIDLDRNYKQVVAAKVRLTNHYYNNNKILIQFNLYIRKNYYTT